MALRFELVLDAALTPRSDRPARIALPLPDSGLTLSIRRSVSASAASNNVREPDFTAWLNDDGPSHHPQLLSRAHAEIGWHSELEPVDEVVD